MPRRRDEMETEPLHVVDRAREADDLELAAVARSGVDLADGERAAEQLPRAHVERAPDLDGVGIARPEELCGYARPEDFREQLHRPITILTRPLDAPRTSNRRFATVRRTG